MNGRERFWPRNRIPFKKPEGYRELDYELLLRNLEAGPLNSAHGGMPWINSPMPNRKTNTSDLTWVCDGNFRLSRGL